MLTTTAIQKIEQILDSLEYQAKELDTNNTKHKAFKFRQNYSLFSDDLFATNSELLTPYVREIRSKTSELHRLLVQDKKSLSHHRLALVEQQIAAVINAINANQSMNKSSSVQRSAITAQRYKKAAKKLFEPIQNLYTKLSETIEFERRLLVMLEEKEALLKQATTTNQQTERSNDVLVIHQRLGRCRQAISKLERQIELQEKR